MCVCVCVRACVRACVCVSVRLSGGGVESCYPPVRNIETMSYQRRCSVMRRYLNVECILASVLQTIGSRK